MGPQMAACRAFQVSLRWGAGAVFLAVLGLVALGGCGRPPQGKSTAAEAAAPPAAGSGASPTTKPGAPPAAKPSPDREIWEVCCLGGVRVGHTRTVIRRITRDAQELVHIDSLTRLAIRRFGKPMETEVRFTSVETPEGRLVECRSATVQQAVSVTTEGRVVGNQLQVKIATKGKTLSSTIPWSAEYGGFYALQQSLARTPMRPGQRRTLRFLDPLTNQVAASELVARDYQSTKLLEGSGQLLRIDSVTTLGDQTSRGVLWTDRAGEIWKSSAEMLNTETFRTTKEIALGETKSADLDIAWKVSVPVDRPLVRPHQTRRVRYRVRLDGGDPAKVFTAGPTQQVRSLDANAAEVTVYAIRPGDGRGNPNAKDDPPAPQDREPNNWIQSDDPKIAALARQAAGGRSDPWEVAVALEKAARGWIRESDYSRGFDSAADVIESRRGDCTEHAVLLAALVRARGIPARVAIGLVYKDQTFLYHMWDEVHLGGRWVPLDATLAQGGIGGAHLKLAHGSLAGASAFASVLPVAQVAGRLKIEVLEAE